MPFITQEISDNEGLTEIYRLRYKVYVDEWRFEKPEKYPNGLEIDAFDKSSIHFASIDDNKRIIGTICLILNSTDGFPIEKHCHLNINRNELLGENLAEISMLTISKNYRRRAEDRYVYGPDEERRNFNDFNNYVNYAPKKTHWRSEDIYRHDFLKKKRVFQERRKRPEIIVSIYKAIYRESKKRGITQWYAVMAKGLYILLMKLGINFQPIGDPVDYYGIRTPYLCDIKKIEHDISVKNQKLYEEFTEGL